MLTTRLLVSVFTIAFMFLNVGKAFGQDSSTELRTGYPNKPIRIVTSGVGGNTDIVARLVAQGIAAPLGQPVIVDNRPSNLVGEIAAKATPDGYTLLVAGGTFMIGPLLEKTSYDPVRDFSTISLLVNSPNVLVVHPSLPVKSVKELISMAKAKPGALNYAATGTGGASQLAMELFKAMAGVNIVQVNYKSTGASLNDLIGGHVQLTIASVGPLIPHIKSGRLSALAVTSAQPSLLAPGLPTVAESVPGYVAVGMTGMFAPAKTRAAIIGRLNQEIVRVLKMPDMKEKFLSSGTETVGSSPEAFAAAMKAEIARMGKVIKDVGIRAE